MKELAMHVYDLMENSTAANAKDVKLTIVDSLKNNDFHFTIEDNGKGMSPEFLAKVTDPYTTSRTTRKVGLGLPLIKMNTEKCGGGMKLTSEVGVGTRLEFWFEHNNWDRPPMGDLPGTLVMLLSAHEDIHFVITYRTAPHNNHPHRQCRPHTTPRLPHSHDRLRPPSSADIHRPRKPGDILRQPLRGLHRRKYSSNQAIRHSGNLPNYALSRHPFRHARHRQ